MLLKLVTHNRSYWQHFRQHFLKIIYFYPRNFSAGTIFHIGFISMQGLNVPRLIKAKRTISTKLLHKGETARTMFRLHFKVYGLRVRFKNWLEFPEKKLKIFFNFFLNSSPTRYVKWKMIQFAYGRNLK